VRPSPSSLNRVSPYERGLVKAERGHKCERCGVTSAEARLVVHHRQRVARGGTHARANLEVLCEACSEAEHGGKGYRR
jgi:hypothetical protein